MIKDIFDSYFLKVIEFITNNLYDSKLSNAQSVQIGTTGDSLSRIITCSLYECIFYVSPPLSAK